MKKNNPYEVIIARYDSEKARVLQDLKSLESSKSLKKCQGAKYVFLVHPSANKVQIRDAFEMIYRDKGVTVTAVNTIRVKPKARRMRRKGARPGFTRGFKKAIITLGSQDEIFE